MVEVLVAPLLPNPPLQRTPSASPPSPLSRQPLGDRKTHGLLRAAAVVVAAALLGVAALGAEECPTRFLSKGLLVKLAAASDAKSLQTIYREAAVPDAVDRLVYASRLMELQPGPRADDLLIAAIPRYELEYEYVYSVTTCELQESAVLNEICGGGWLEPVAKAIVRRGHGMEAFLRLSYFNNAELAELLPAWNSWLRSQSPALFRTSLGRLPAEVRKSVEFE